MALAPHSFGEVTAEIGRESQESIYTIRPSMAEREPNRGELDPGLFWGLTFDDAVDGSGTRRSR